VVKLDKRYGDFSKVGATLFVSGPVSVAHDCPQQMCRESLFTCAVVGVVRNCRAGVLGGRKGDQRIWSYRPNTG